LPSEQNKTNQIKPKTSSVASLAMLTQLSLFDLSGNFNFEVGSHVRAAPAAGPFAAVAGTELCKEPESHYESAAATPMVEKELAAVRIYGESRREDSIQPMGELARLVLARYEMMARRREEMMRRKAEQPRKSIRVLSPS